MFELLLDRDCFSRVPLVTDEAVRFDEVSHITKVPTEAVTIRHMRSPTRWMTLVSEVPSATNILPRTGEVNESYYESLYDGLTALDVDYCVVEARYAGPDQYLRILTRGIGVCPIYLDLKLGRMRASWDCAALARASSNVDLDTQYLVHASQKISYSNRTPYVGITMMTPNCDLMWDGNNPILTNHASADEQENTLDITSAEAQDDFAYLLSRSCSRRCLSVQEIAVELSGGLDSSSLALCLFDISGPVQHNVSIDVLGRSVATQQLRRLRSVRSICSRSFYSVPIENYLPAYDQMHSAAAQTFQSESFYGAFRAIWTSAIEAGCNVIYGGHGGDELFPSFQDEPSYEDRLRDGSSPSEGHVDARYRHCLTVKGKELYDGAFWYSVPVPPSRITALMSMARHTPLVLKQNLWPIYPLCDLELVDFCHSLPAHLRREKRPLLNYVRHHLGRRSPFEKYEKENFVPAVRQALFCREPQIRRLANGSMRVYDLDIVDRNCFSNDVDNLFSAAAYQNIHHICSILHLESFLAEQMNAGY